jgi:predicted RNA polymerase sigma factor
MNDDALRVIAPKVLGILVRRGHDFAAAEDALQEALLEAHQRLGRAGARRSGGLAAHRGRAQAH